MKTDAGAQFQFAKRGFKLELRTYHYICARVGLSPSQLKNRISPKFRPQAFLRHLAQLDRLCRYRALVGVADLVREAEDVLSLTEAASILGKTRNRVHERIIRYNVEPVSMRPYVYIYWFDIWQCLGLARVSMLLRNHPLWRWRREARLTAWQASRLLMVERLQYLKWEAGAPVEAPAALLEEITLPDMVKRLSAWQELRERKA